MKKEFVKILKERFKDDSICLNIDDLRELAKKPFDELKEGMPFLPEGMNFPTEDEKKKIRNLLNV